MEKQNQLYYDSVILTISLFESICGLKNKEPEIAMLEAQCFGFLCPERERQKQEQTITAESGIVHLKKITNS